MPLYCFVVYCLKRRQLTSTLTLTLTLTYPFLFVDHGLEQH